MCKPRLAIPWVLVAVAFCATFGQLPLRASAVELITEFSFRGDCFDCTGQGTGTLLLQNYTLGNPLDLTNFVRFSYSSDLTSFVLMGTGPDPGQVSDFSGSLDMFLPGFKNINMSSVGAQIFQSVDTGGWCAGFNGCNLDFGINGIWDNAPEPSGFALAFSGLAGLLLLRLRRAKARRSPALP
jgi:hypothetical protein